MYTIDRQSWSNILGISTRTIDRYIKAWKIRVKKEWKHIYLNEKDIEKIKNWWLQEDYEIIDRNAKIVNYSENKNTGENIVYKKLYEQTKIELDKKNELIKEISYNLWKAETELKNSISILEYRKVAFLLESSKWNVEEREEKLTKEINNLENNLSSNKKFILILIIFVIILLFLSFVIWFIKI